MARYGGLTGSPEESGARRREKGLARAGNARVRRGMLQLAWRFLMFQKDSALAQWYRARTADARGATRKTMIVALARKLLVALWKLVTTGELPNGVVLRPAIQAALNCRVASPAVRNEDATADLAARATADRCQLACMGVVLLVPFDTEA